MVIQGFSGPREMGGLGRARGEAAERFLVGALGVPPERLRVEDLGSVQSGEGGRGGVRFSVVQEIEVQLLPDLEP